MTPPSNPYLASRRAWNDHVGNIIAARAMWQIVALFSLLVAAASVGGLIHVATSSKFVPYVVEVDKAGTVEAVKRAARMAPASRAVIEAQVEEFVTLSRRVTTDIALQRAAVRGVFAMMGVGEPCTEKMRQHLIEAHPVERAKQVTVTTAIESVIPQTEDTWQIDWTEHVYARTGELQQEIAMRALVQVFQSEPSATDEKALKENPLSIYVRDYNWGPRGKRQVTL